MSSLYNSIGKGYDTTRKADCAITHRLRHHLQAAEGSRILDAACGTGNYTIALQESGLQMTGADISSEMIAQAKAKAADIDWQLADVNNLTFSDHSFHGTTCILSIHHFDNLSSAFREVYRVMEQGRFVIFTSAPEQMNNYWLKKYFPEAIEASANQMPEAAEVDRTLQAAGFTIIGHETFLIQPDLQDFFLYSGKYEPQMYLDEKVRAGISTFANLASKKEIKEGLSRLEKDIRTNKIEEVKQKFSSNLGDYMFIVAEKKKKEN